MELHRFDSFGEFEGAVIDVDLKVRLLGPRDGNWRIGNADVDGITVQTGVEAVPNLCEASGWPTHLMFLISDGHPTPTWLNGVPFGDDRIGILAPRQGFVFRAAGPNEWVTIALPLSSPLFQMDDAVSHALRGWCKSTRMVACAPAAIRFLRQAALKAANMRAPFTTTGRTLIEAAVVQLVASRRQQARALGRPGVSPHDLCDATIGLFRSSDNDLTAKAQRLDGLPVGRRSLSSFFRHCFGLSPTQYLHLRQLHAIHAALQELRACSMPIVDIFERQGYPYSAYALAQYRGIFGESPSTTRERHAPAQSDDKTVS